MDARCVETKDYMTFFARDWQGDEPQKFRCDKSDRPYKETGFVESIKLSALEVVDMKITDNCGQGCAFCYQSSTPEGKRGDSWLIQKTIVGLQRKGVFEIALGGGDIFTMGSSLETILKSPGIDINFSTASLDFVYDANLYDVINKNVSAFALSVCNASQLQEIEKLNCHPKKYVHHVLGTADFWELTKIVTGCKEKRIPLILLGFKAIGRGEKYLKFNSNMGHWS